MSSSFKAHVALFLANFFYGINYVVVKKIMPTYIEPSALVFVRLIPSTILIWFVSIWMAPEKSEKLNYKLFLLAAFFGVFLNQLSFIQGLNLTSPIDASILITSNPIMVLIVAMLFKKEKSSVKKLLGILIGSFGIVMLIGEKGVITLRTDHFVGNFLLILNAISFALYILFTKPLMQQHNAIDVLKYTFLFGSIFFIPFGFFSFLHTSWHSMPKDVILSLLYIVLITTVLTYLLINYGIRHLKSTTVSIYIYIQPLVASVLSVFLGFDRFTFFNITAGFLVITGVYLVSRAE